MSKVIHSFIFVFLRIPYPMRARSSVFVCVCVYVRTRKLFCTWVPFVTVLNLDTSHFSTKPLKNYHDLYQTDFFPFTADSKLLQRTQRPFCAHILLNWIRSQIYRRKENGLHACGKGDTESPPGENVRLRPGWRRQKTKLGEIPAEATVGLRVVPQLEDVQN